MKIKYLIPLLVALALLTPLPLALGQVTPTEIGSFTLPSSVITDTATSNILSAVLVRQGKPLAIAPYFATTNSSTANVILTFDFSADGTNYTTVDTITKTNVLDGTTAVRGYHVISADTIGPARYIRLKTIENAHNATIWITNVVYAWPN